MVLTKDAVFRWDEESDATFQNLTEELAKTHTGKLTKNLTRKHVPENEAVTNGKVETGSGGHTHDDPHHGTNKEAVTGISDNEDKQATTVAPTTTPTTAPTARLARGPTRRSRRGRWTTAARTSR